MDYLYVADLDSDVVEFTEFVAPGPSSYWVHAASVHGIVAMVEWEEGDLE